MATPYDAVAQQNAQAAIQALTVRARSEAPGYPEKFILSRASEYLNSSSATNGMTPLEIYYAEKGFHDLGGGRAYTPSQLEELRQSAERSMQERAGSNVAEYKNDPRYHPGNTQTQGYTSTPSANERAMQDNGSGNYDATQGTVFKNVMAKVQAGQALNPTEIGVLERSGYGPNGKPLNGQAGNAPQKGSMADTYYGPDGKPAYYANNTTKKPTSGDPASSDKQGAGTSADTVDNIQAGRDYIMNNPNLTDDQKSVFLRAYEAYPADQNINLPLIVSEFTKIKDETIDPYFKEQIKMYTDEVVRSRDYQDAAQKIEQEGNDMTAIKAINDTKASLEASGMTFSGQARGLLGSQSALGQGGEQNNLIQPTPFGGQTEGTVVAANRLMGTSSKLRYQQQRDALARQAEAQLGSAGSAGLVPGVVPLGGIKGDIERQRMTKYGAEADRLGAQYSSTTDMQQPIKFNFA